MKTPVVAIATCLWLFGCQAPNHLVYVHEATLGIDVSASTEGTGRLVLGYDRDTFSIIPRKHTDSSAEQPDTGSDAMSLATVNCVYAQGLDNVQFRHFVATGKTAVGVVAHPKLLEEVKNIIQGGGEKCSP